MSGLRLLFTPPAGKLPLMKLAEFFSNYFTVRKELVEAVKGLSREQLDWCAPGHPNSIGHLLAHVAETEFWWISIVAEKNVAPSQTDFQRFENDLTADRIFAWLEEHFAETGSFLRREELDDWDGVFYSFEIDGKEEKVSKRWLVWHVVEHQARHRGQIFMLMRMQGLDVPNV